MDSAMLSIQSFVMTLGIATEDPDLIRLSYLL
jgi:hypothetical protein